MGDLPIQQSVRPLTEFRLAGPEVTNAEGPAANKHVTRPTGRGYWHHFNADNKIPRPVPAYMSVNT